MPYVDAVLWQIVENFTYVTYWSANIFCLKVWLITDGRAGLGEGCNNQTSHDVSASSSHQSLPHRLPYQLHVVCIAGSTDPALVTAEPQYRHLIAKGSPAGQLYVPDGVLCERSVRQMFSTIGEKHYATFTGTLRCGNLRCPVYVFPAPEDYDRYTDGNFCQQEILCTMYIILYKTKLLLNLWLLFVTCS